MWRSPAVLDSRREHPGKVGQIWRKARKFVTSRVPGVVNVLRVRCCKPLYHALNFENRFRHLPGKLS